MLARSEKELREVEYKLEHAAKNFGLIINEEKTKYMVMEKPTRSAEREGIRRKTAY